jgi:hypothetical protein
MDKRPTSITIIAWHLIVAACFLFLYFTANFQDPGIRDSMSKESLPLSLQIIITYLGLLISLVSGVGFLKRQNWARFLYCGWCVIGSIIGFAASPMRITALLGFALYLLVTFFLFRPKANAYFLSREGLTGNGIDINTVLPKKSLWLSILRIIFYILSALFLGSGTLMAFLNDDHVIPVVIIFIALSFLSLTVSLSFNRFQKWKKISGIVLIAGSAYGAVIVATIELASLSPEFRKSVQTPADFSILNDYSTGLSFFILFIAVGLLLLKFHKAD